MKMLGTVRLLLATAVAVVLFALPAMAEARTKGLQPVFLIKISNPSAAQTETVLRRSLAGRHWVITRATPNEIEAKLTLREHSITTKFTWAADQVSIVYVTSENMEYEVDGDDISINRNYYRWLKYLRRDIINYGKRAAAANSALAQDNDADDDKDEAAPAAGK